MKSYPAEESLKKILLPSLLLFVAGTLRAQEPTDVSEYPIDIALGECLSIDENQSTQGMIECVRVAEDAWDAEMNSDYKELMGMLDSAGQENLRTAQRAWLKYRDAEIELCAAIYYGNLEGTMYHIMAADRVMSIVRARALELQAYIDMLSEGGE